MNSHNDAGDTKMRFALGGLLKQRAFGNQRIRSIHNE